MWHVRDRREVHIGNMGGDLRERDHMESLGMDGKMILNCIFRKWEGGMDWIDVAEDRYR
jgi:hypothetical protein